MRSPKRNSGYSVDTEKIANLLVTSGKLAANAAGEGKVPIDNTLQFDGSGDLGVNTQRVVQTVSEWVQHFASGSAHDTSGHSGKYQEYTSSNVVRRVGSVQYDFTPGNSGGTRTYQVFIVELTGRNIDVILGSSEVYSGNNLQHRFHFVDGVTINPNVRIGIGLHRTDGGNNEALSVRFGTESQDSPRESYDDASEDFNFVGRFNHDRPTPTVNDTVGGTTAGEIYGNPEIFYQIIHTHESLVGDGTVSSAHISSGSADCRPTAPDGRRIRVARASRRDPVIQRVETSSTTRSRCREVRERFGHQVQAWGGNAKITAIPVGDVTATIWSKIRHRWHELPCPVTRHHPRAVRRHHLRHHHAHVITVAVTGGNRARR